MEENVAWKVALPDRGNSTPVVWGDKVFVTQAIEKEGKRLLLCFDKKTGKQLWDAGTIYKEKELTHATNPYCAASPATDGERVIVFHASAGVFCYDLNGKELWKRTDLGKQHHIWGNGTSPVIAGDRVFLNFGPGENTVLYASTKRRERPCGSTRNPAVPPVRPATRPGSAPGVIRCCASAGSRDELLMSYPGRACAFDPMSGKELWTCGGLTPLVYNSPLFADGTGDFHVRLRWLGDGGENGRQRRCDGKEPRLA
jgi:outer membrane protein assembly factor BamB